MRVLCAPELPSSLHNFTVLLNCSKDPEGHIESYLQAIKNIRVTEGFENQERSILVVSAQIILFNQKDLKTTG